MKNSLWIGMFFSLLLQGSIVLADEASVSWRQDVGFATAESLWIADNEKKFDTFGGAEAGNSNVMTVYTRTTFTAGLSDTTNLNVYAEYTQSNMNGFTAAGTPKGDTESGLSAISFGFDRSIYQAPGQRLSLEFGVEVPGDTTRSATKFNSINDGASKYQIGLSHVWNRSGFDVQSSISYAHRPGFLNLKGLDPNDTSQTVQRSFAMHDIVSFSLSLPFYAGGIIYGPDINYATALGGIDIGSDEWNDAATTQKLGPPFPGTREISLSGGFFVGMMVSETLWMDFYYNNKFMGRNTDKNQSFNIGFEFGI